MHKRIRAITFDIGGTLVAPTGQRSSPPSIRDDAIDVLKELKARGYALGVISNVRESDWLPLEHLGFPKEMFAWTIFSFQCGLAKPDRAVFQLFEDISGHQPGRLCHVGDSLFHDYQPAIDKGWSAFLISTARPSASVLTVNNLCELLNHFQR